MKKFLAIALAAMMILGITAAFASAESTAEPTAPGQTQLADRGRGPMGGPQGTQGQAPNGQRQAPNGKRGQAPDGQQQAPNGKKGQAPNDQQLPSEQQAPNGQQAPDAQKDQRPDGKQKTTRGKKIQQVGNGRVDFDALLKQGVITQETYDSIMKYMQENAPKEQPAQQPAAPTDAAQAPTDGDKPADVPELPADGEGGDLLKDLLSSGTITQDTYDAITTATTKGKN
ncbi:MAG: hypothetical protein IJ662_02275 [Clostridia bacterium]|nr:hypothetical protein [Clostridia bacterium]